MGELVWGGGCSVHSVDLGIGLRGVVRAGVRRVPICSTLETHRVVGGRPRGPGGSSDLGSPHLIGRSPSEGPERDRGHWELGTCE